MTKLLIISLFTICLLSSATLAAKKSDVYYMQRAIEMAKQNPEAPFGAVIVDNNTGEILAEGVNSVVKQHNPTLHGEVVVINNYAMTQKQLDWKNVTLYTTAEPCSMCQSAIVWAGISRVVFGTSMEYLLRHHWDQIKISSRTVNANSTFYRGTIKGGVLSDETDILFNK